MLYSHLSLDGGDRVQQDGSVIRSSGDAERGQGLALGGEVGGGTACASRSADLPGIDLPDLARCGLALGGSAQGAEITDALIELLKVTPEQLAVTYDGRLKSVLIIGWIGLGRTPSSPGHSTAPGAAFSYSATSANTSSPSPKRKGELLARLHRLSPAGFEEFTLYLLRTFGIELTRVGGVGDEGIDGLGLAPISAVLSSRAAVQAKRYDPTATVGREIVALFQRDAAAAGAERAVLVTLARFSPAARKAATVTTPTVDLIDGDKLCDLVRDQQIGLRIVAQVDEGWFDRFDA